MTKKSYPVPAEYPPGETRNLARVKSYKVWYSVEISGTHGASCSISARNFDHAQVLADKINAAIKEHAA